MRKCENIPSCLRQRSQGRKIAFLCGHDLSLGMQLQETFDTCRVLRSAKPLSSIEVKGYKRPFDYWKNSCRIWGSKVAQWGKIAKIHASPRSIVRRKSFNSFRARQFSCNLLFFKWIVPEQIDSGTIDEK